MSDFLEIPLAGGKGVALVDREDWAGLSKYSWHNSNGYARTIIHGKTVAMHRIILGLGESDLVCDHINHDRLDNRRANLRACTQQQNNWNCLPNYNRKYKGPYKISDSVYLVKIKLSSKNIYVGCYRTEEDAAKAYNLAAIKYFGEFACLNDVDHSIPPFELDGDDLIFEIYKWVCEILDPRKFGWLDIYDLDDLKQEAWIVINESKSAYHNRSIRTDPFTYFFHAVKNHILSLKRQCRKQSLDIEQQTLVAKSTGDATELAEEILDCLDQRMRADMLRMLDGMKIDKNRADQLRRKVRSILEDMEYYG